MFNSQSERLTLDPLYPKVLTELMCIKGTAHSPPYTHGKRQYGVDAYMPEDGGLRVWDGPEARILTGPGHCLDRELLQSMGFTAGACLNLGVRPQL